jgi:PDZ domain-containing protein
MTFSFSMGKLADYLCCLWAALAMPACALAQSAAAQGAVKGSLLAELNSETQALYRHVAAGVVRVELPMHRGTTLPSSSDPLAPWSDKLSPDVRARLSQLRPPGVAYVAELVPTPASSLSGPAMGRQFYIFSPNVLGVVVDSDGYALLPLYAAPEDVGKGPLPVMLCDGTMTQARFVGSDKLTNVTIVQVPHAAVKPLMFTAGPPVEGSLVMLMSMDPSATHLGVWTRWANNWGLVIRSTDGAVAGFSQRGRFLGASGLGPVVLQIIQHGSVRRPRLGVAIRDVPPDDPQRQFVLALGDMPAIRVTGVIPNSPAAKADLRRGDLILSLGKQTVGDAASFAAAIAAASRGPTQMQILRQDELISVTVDLEADLPQ